MVEEEGNEAMEAQIQFQDISGNWLTVTVLQFAIMANVLREMQQVASSHPGRRVRAVDMNGRLIDML